MYIDKKKKLEIVCKGYGDGVYEANVWVWHDEDN